METHSYRGNSSKGNSLHVLTVRLPPTEYLQWPMCGWREHLPSLDIAQPQGRKLEQHLFCYCGQARHTLVTEADDIRKGA